MTRAVPEWIAKHDDQAIPPRVKDRVLEAHGNRCALTGREFRPGDSIDFDHIQALANGGAHRESNLQPVLREAHREKTAEDVGLKAKTARIRKKRFGFTPARHQFPGAKNGRVKFKLNGSIIDRATGAMIREPRFMGDRK